MMMADESMLMNDDRLETDLSLGLDGIWFSHIGALQSSEIQLIFIFEHLS
jgi:hypothetical protein